MPSDGVRVAAAIGAAALIASSLLPSAAAAASCSVSATPSTFASQVSAASAGQTICLASGSYGTWAGTNKALTITAAGGATPTMQVDFASGASGFTIDGLSGMSGDIDAGAKNITIRNSSFSDQLMVLGAMSNIVLDHDHFDWNAVSYSGGPNSKMFVNTTGTLSAPALTISNTTFTNGDLDGVHFGGGSGVLVLNDTFSNLCQGDYNHTDNIQFDSTRTSQVRIANNLVYEAQSCATQGITSYDAGTSGVIIEDNVVDIPRDWGIEIYADQNSIIRHNTVVAHPKSYSMFNTGTGRITVDHKDGDPAGTGTQVYDNLAVSVEFKDGSTGSAHNNVDSTNAKYLGPTTTSWNGYQLASDSPVGRNAADDGTDAGIQANANPTPTPNPTAVTSLWTAPSSVTVGTPVVLDGTRSTGTGITCTWSFEDDTGSTGWETEPGCKLTKTFQTTGTKYVNLIVTDSAGNTDTNKQAFTAAAATTTPIPTPTPTSTPTPTPVPTATPWPTPSPTPPSAAAPAPAARLVSSFGFDEGSGRIVHDASGLGNTGSLHGATWTKSGRHGGALSFNGSSYVTVADAPSLHLTTGLTLEAWLRPTSADRKLRSAIAKVRSGGVDYALDTSDTAGRASGQVRTAGESSVTARALSANTWSHLALTFDGSTLRVYINGALTSSNALTGALATGTGELRLGRGFKGVMDDVHVWDAALSSSALRSEVEAVKATASHAKRPKRAKHKRRGHQAE